MENHSSIQEVLFFTRAFSKFSPELQQSALQPASAGALHGMTSSRKWSEKSKSWTSQNPKGSYCGHFQNELSLVQFLGSGQKVCLDGGDGGGCSCAFLQHSKAPKTGVLLPSFPGKPTWLAGHDSRAGGVQSLELQAGSSVLAFHRLVVGSSASQGGKLEELL